MEDEILLKSGEIRVLRDSLKAAQQEKEAERQNQVILETQRQKEHSDREKELNKKVTLVKDMDMFILHSYSIVCLLYAGSVSAVWAAV